MDKSGTRKGQATNRRRAGGAQRGEHDGTTLRRALVSIEQAHARRVEESRELFSFFARWLPARKPASISPRTVVLT